MKGSARTAAAIGVGYVFGRQHKLRAAAMMAAVAAFGSTSAGGMVMRRGVKLLGTASGLTDKMPPEIGEIIDVVRGDLLPAGKAAVSAAATSRVDSLTDALHERAELARDPGAAVSGAADEAKRKTGGTASAARRKTRIADRDDETDEDRPDEAEEPEDEEVDERDERDERDDEEPDEADEEPLTRVRTATRRRAPVTRARR